MMFVSSVGHFGPHTRRKPGPIERGCGDKGGGHMEWTQYSTSCLCETRGKGKLVVERMNNNEGLLAVQEKLKFSDEITLGGTHIRHCKCSLNFGF
jgi:hypothetical protein